MPSAGHCGRHHNYRCRICEIKFPNSYSSDWTPQDAEEMEAQLSTLKAQREWVSKSDAVAFEYQHEETGQIGYVDQWQVDNGFFENNPRLQLIGPLYRHPPAPEGE